MPRQCVSFQHHPDDPNNFWSNARKASSKDIVNTAKITTNAPRILVHKGISSNHTLGWLVGTEPEGGFVLKKCPVFLQRWAKTRKHSCNKMFIPTINLNVSDA